MTAPRSRAHGSCICCATSNQLQPPTCTAADRAQARIECGDQRINTTLEKLQAAAGTTMNQYRNAATLSSIFSGQGMSGLAGIGQAGGALRELGDALTAERIPMSMAAFVDITERFRTRRTAHALVKVRSAMAQPAGKWCVHCCCT